MHDVDRRGDVGVKSNVRVNGRPRVSSGGEDGFGSWGWSHCRHWVRFPALVSNHGASIAEDWRLIELNRRDIPMRVRNCQDRAHQNYSAG